MLTKLKNRNRYFFLYFFFTFNSESLFSKSLYDSVHDNQLFVFPWWLSLRKQIMPNRIVLCEQKGLTRNICKWVIRKFPQKQIWDSNGT